MKKVFEILGQPLLANRDVGIEIECEGENLKVWESPYWKIEDDGSLRGVFPTGRAEYVLKKPIPIKSVGKAMDDIILAQKEAKFNFSFRTSVHVHVNVQELTEKELVSMIYTYLLLEEAFMNYCGKERKGNRFCLRLQDADGILDFVNSIVEHGLPWFVANSREDHMRYSAINLAALRKYGSLEFRGMRGTMDKTIITNWCNALVNVRSYAVLMQTPTKIYEEFAELGPLAFMQKVLGDYSDVFNSPKLEREINRSFSLSIDIPHMFAFMELNNKEEAPLKAANKYILKPLVMPQYANAVPVPRAPARRRPIILDDFAPQIQV